MATTTEMIDEGIRQGKSQIDIVSHCWRADGESFTFDWNKVWKQVEDRLWFTAVGTIRHHWQLTPKQIQRMIRHTLHFGMPLKVIIDIQNDVKSKEAERKAARTKFAKVLPTGKDLAAALPYKPDPDSIASIKATLSAPFQRIMATPEPEEPQTMAKTEPKNSAEIVRELLASGMTSPKEIASVAQDKFGVTITAQYISVIKSKQGKVGGTVAKTKPKASTATVSVAKVTPATPTEPAATPKDDVAALKMAFRFVLAAGGFAEAHGLIDALQKD